MSFKIRRSVAITRRPEDTANAEGLVETKRRHPGIDHAPGDQQKRFHVNGIMQEAPLEYHVHS